MQSMPCMPSNALYVVNKLYVVNDLYVHDVVNNLRGVVSRKPV